MLADDRGLALTAANAEAVASYCATVDQYLEYRAGVAHSLKQTLAVDPDFVMGHCLKGYLFLLFGTNAVLEKVRASLAAAEAGKDRVTWREQAHVAALAAWSEGDLLRACAMWDEILLEYPTDLLALRLHHFNTFWMGRSAVLRDAIARVLPAWDEGTPGYGYVLGMHAFGLEECGEYSEAEAKGRRAVELNGDDLWSIHAVAHVLEMQGRLRDGTTWLSQPLGAWADRNPFKDHLWWHTALFPLELGEFDRVLALYDDAVRVDQSDFYLDVQNAASLLLRLELQGVSVGDRWRELADIAESRVGDHVLAFTDLHFMMALAADRRFATCRRLLASLRDFSGRRGNFAAATMEPVTIPLCEAILAYAEGEYGRAVDLMLPIRYDLACVGGSHAQRDIFAQILIAAALKDGRFKLARALLAERLAQRPRSHGAWLKYAQALDGLGDAAGAQTARRRSLERPSD